MQFKAFGNADSNNSHTRDMRVFTVVTEKKRRQKCTSVVRGTCYIQHQLLQRRQQVLLKSQ